MGRFLPGLTFVFLGSANFEGEKKETGNCCEAWEACSSGVYSFFLEGVGCVPLLLLRFPLDSRPRRTVVRRVFLSSENWLRALFFLSPLRRVFPCP